MNAYRISVSGITTEIDAVDIKEATHKAVDIYFRQAHVNQFNLQVHFSVKEVSKCG